jgi:hypothetical protein
MKPTRLASVLAAVVLLVSGCSLTTHHTATRAPHTARIVAHALPADPSLGLLNDLHISLLR